jgi:hypothetical protein
MRTFGSTPIADPNVPTRLNVFIDANSMVKSIYNIEPSMMQAITPSVIAASLINLAAHIRKYFLSRHGTWCNIYIAYANNLPDDVLSNPLNLNYNISNRNKMEANDLARERIDKAFEILELLCPYIPEVYFYRERSYGAETASLINRMIDYANEFKADKKKPDVSLIYSRDTYMYQLVATKSMTVLYRPKKSNQNDISFSVYKSNLFDAYRYNELKNKVDSTDRYYGLRYDTFGLILAYSGLKSRSIKSKVSFTSACKHVSVLVNANLIRNGYNGTSTINMIKDQIDKFGDEIYSRYSVLDVVDRCIFYNQRPNIIENSLVDLNDPEAVKEINNIYFRRNPLDLQNL